MSSVFVQAGQCGNQLGCSVLSGLYNELSSNDAAIDRYFRTSKSGKLTARTVLLDTEPKVINECIARTKVCEIWRLDGKSVCYQHGGAGNNWAAGYAMCSGDYLVSALNCIRRELEFCDRHPSIICEHAVAGGTGSGLGTHITEACNDEFPDVDRINIAVTPYHFGEVVVQHYNALLSLSKISSSSDAVFLFENEVAQQLCMKMKGIVRPSLQDINAVIASNIVSALLPKYTVDQHSGYQSILPENLGQLCPHPGYRFLDIRTTPQTSSRAIDYTYDTWYTIVNTLARMQLHGWYCERGMHKITGDASVTSPKKAASADQSQSVPSLASLLILHGPDARAAAGNIDIRTDNGVGSPRSDRHGYQQSLSPGYAGGPGVPGVPGGPTRVSYEVPHSTILADPVTVAYSPLSVQGYQRSGCLVSNGCGTLPLLNRTAARAAELFHTEAYLHQYSNHGVEKEDFVQSFRQLGQVIENYNSLCK